MHDIKIDLWIEFSFFCLAKWQALYYKCQWYAFGEKVPGLQRQEPRHHR